MRVVVTVLLLAACSSAAHRAPRPAASPTLDVRATLQHLVDQRSQAVRDHDEATWLATVDQTTAAFVQRERSVFAVLTALPLETWTSTVAVDGGVTLTAGFTGFDDVPTSTAERLTFTTGPHPLVSGDTSATMPWDVGLSAVTRGTRTLVLHRPGADAQATAVAAVIDAAVPVVAKAWGTDWSQRVVVLLPGSVADASALIGGPDDEDAATTLADQSRSGTGDVRSGGDRIVINPIAFAGATALQQRILAQHEVTHVATRPFTTAAMPTWLIEGYADMVGFEGIDARTGAPALAAAVRAGRTPTELPPDADFRGTGDQVDLAYQGARLACQELGTADATRLYRLVGQGATVDAALVTITGKGLAAFTARWQDALRAELS